MTIIEVMISIVVVSLISLSIAAMLHVAGYGTDARREVRRLTVRSQQVRLRIDDAIRNACQVLNDSDDASDNAYNHLVLWQGDLNDDGKTNLDELELILIVNDQLIRYTVNRDTAIDSDYVSTILNHGDRVASPWATSVSEFSVVLDNVDPALASLVTWSATVTDNDLSETLIGTMALRARKE